MVLGKPWEARGALAALGRILLSDPLKKGQEGGPSLYHYYYGDHSYYDKNSDSYAYACSYSYACCYYDDAYDIQYYAWYYRHLHHYHYYSTATRWPRQGVMMGE